MSREALGGDGGDFKDCFRIGRISPDRNTRIPDVQAAGSRTVRRPSVEHLRGRIAGRIALVYDVGKRRPAQKKPRFGAALPDRK